MPSVSKQAEKVMDELREKKAGSMMKIAEFYEKRKKYESAIIYYNDVVGKFPDTKAAAVSMEKIKKLKGQTKK